MPSNRFDFCPAFTAGTPTDSSKMFKDHGSGTTYLSWAHPSRRGNLTEPRHPDPGAKTFRCQKETGRGVCGKHNRASIVEKEMPAQ